MPSFVDYTEADILMTFFKLDLDKIGKVDYFQFWIASIDPELLQDEALLECLFNELDSLQEGFLTKESIEVALVRNGIILT